MTGDAAEPGEPGAPPAPLRPHRYPLPMLAVALAAVLAAAWSAAFQVPRLVGATRDLHAGRAALTAGDAETARMRFAAALDAAPDSRKALLGEVEAMFADGDAANDAAALDLLGDTRLSASEWRELTRYMPERYQALFTSTTSIG